MEFSYPAAAISEPLCSCCEGSHPPADPLYRASVGFLNTPSEVIDALPFEICWIERRQTTERETVVSQSWSDVGGCSRRRAAVAGTSTECGEHRRMRQTPPTYCHAVFNQHICCSLLSDGFLLAFILCVATRACRSKAARKTRIASQPV